MKGKILLLLTATIAATLAFSPMAKGLARFQIYGYTDKPQYKAGESGTLKFWIYNDGTDDLILKNISIRYPWYSPIWGGNETMKNLDTIVSAGGNLSYSTAFTVPADGRAIEGSVNVNVVTDKVTDTESFTMHVASVPYYSAFEDMDKIVSLFTILVVLVIVCTIIIASTLFLSARRPKVTWKAEDKQ